VLDLRSYGLSSCVQKIRNSNDVLDEVTLCVCARVRVGGGRVGSGIHLCIYVLLFYLMYFSLFAFILVFIYLRGVAITDIDTLSHIQRQDRHITGHPNTVLSFCSMFSISCSQ
jgi:hypothetical protein